MKYRVIAIVNDFEVVNKVYDNKKDAEKLYGYLFSAKRIGWEVLFITE